MQNICRRHSAGLQSHLHIHAFDSRTIRERFANHLARSCMRGFKLSTHLWTNSALVYIQLADFVCRLLLNKSNMIWNFLSRIHICNLSMNNRRTLSIDTSSPFCLQVCTKPKNLSEISLKIV